VKTRSTRRMAAAFLSLVLLLVTAPAVFADGEIGDMGDTDSTTDLYESTDANGNVRTTARIDYPKDCPDGLSCQIEVRFTYKCPEFWCGSWASQNWRAIPAPVNGVSTVRADCLGPNNEENYWTMQYRVKWWAPQVRTVELWGEQEFYLSTSGGLIHRTVAEAAFNSSAGTGWRQGTKIETTTAVQDYGPEVEVATSFGTVFQTC
jgi:hypothetical protein